MKKGKLLERLDAGEIIIGDGGMVHQLERRCYVSCGLYTPEVVVEHPDAVRSLHKEFALARADVIEAFTFNGSDEQLNKFRSDGYKLDFEAVNHAACAIAREVATEYGCFLAGPVSPSYAYNKKLGKAKVQEEFRKQMSIYKQYDVDLLIAEYINAVEEAEWAVEVMKEFGLPTAISLCIGELGDVADIPLDDCAIRLAKTGADIIGVNCLFDPDMSVNTAIKMMSAIHKEGLKPHFIVQPMGYHSKDMVGKNGLLDAPELPLAMESRLISRWDAYKFARKAYEAGIRYIGGCCGFQSYHIRALAEELHKERGRLPANSRGLYADCLKAYHFQPTRLKATKEYWYNLVPRSGR